MVSIDLRKSAKLWRSESRSLTIVSSRAAVSAWASWLGWVFVGVPVEFDVSSEPFTGNGCVVVELSWSSSRPAIDCFRLALSSSSPSSSGSSWAPLASGASAEVLVLSLVFFLFFLFFLEAATWPRQPVVCGRWKEGSNQPDLEATSALKTADMFKWRKAQRYGETIVYGVQSWHREGTTP